MARGGIEQRGGGWRWRVTAGGVSYSGTEPTREQAERARLEAKLNGGARIPAEEHTVGELVSLWLADVDHAGSTAVRRDIALAAVPKTFKARPIRSVTAPVVAALWRQMADAGTGAHTIVKASHALSQAFELGVRYGMVPMNPIRLVKPKTPRSARRPAPTPAQVRSVLAQLPDGSALAAWARFMAVCGARPGEICGLQWDDLDADRSRVRIERAVDRSGEITDGKTGESGHRWVDVDLPTFTALRRIERVVGCPWVFTHDGETPWRPDWAAKRVHDAIEAAGVKMRPYDLRHFAATQAIAAGRPIPEVAAMLGDNPATVMRTYAHAIPGESQAASVVAAVLDGG